MQARWIHQGWAVVHTFNLSLQFSRALCAQGTYAKVKYGQHVESGEAVAVKVLDKEQLVRSGMVEQIKREITILKQVGAAGNGGLAVPLVSAGAAVSSQAVLHGEAHGPPWPLQPARALATLSCALLCKTTLISLRPYAAARQTRVAPSGTCW